MPRPMGKRLMNSRMSTASITELVVVAYPTPDRTPESVAEGVPVSMSPSPAR